MSNQELQSASDNLKGLSQLFPSNQVTKATIDEFATKLVKSFDNPLMAAVKIKIISELADSIKSKLEDKLFDQISNIPESERRVGNIRFTKMERTTIKYNDDNQVKDMERQIKDRKKVIKAKMEEGFKHIEETGEIINLPVSYSKTSYLKWDIPKD